MAAPRIYSAVPLCAGESLSLDESARRHVGQVLRLKAGQSITLFDGHGGQFPATIDRIERREIVANIGQQEPIEQESPLTTHLFQGISKGERMDYAIQKATEIGVTSITPLLCERTVVRIEPKRMEKKMAHWQGVAISACEQCGRNQLPEIRPVLSLKEALSHAGGSRIVLDPDGDHRLSDLPPNQQAVSLLIGPEGGLSPSELDQANSHEFSRVRIGPRVLRTETATVVALTALQQLWGDY